MVCEKKIKKDLDKNRQVYYIDRYNFLTLAAVKPWEIQKELVM